MKIPTRLKCDKCLQYRNNTIVLPTPDDEGIVWCDICLTLELGQLRKFRREIEKAKKQRNWITDTEGAV